MNEANPFDAPPIDMPASPPNGARFLGHERAFWRLLMRGAALLLVTLGIYRFSLAPDVRRFLWRNTYCGDLQGHFVGSGMRLFFRGVLFWFVVIGPFLFGLMLAIGAVDWTALGEAVRRGGDDLMGRVEAAGVAPALVVAVLSIGW